MGLSTPNRLGTGPLSLNQECLNANANNLKLKIKIVCMHTRSQNHFRL